MSSIEPQIVLIIVVVRLSFLLRSPMKYFLCCFSKNLLKLLISVASNKAMSFSFLINCHPTFAFLIARVSESHLRGIVSLTSSISSKVEGTEIYLFPFSSSCIGSGEPLIVEESSVSLIFILKSNSEAMSSSNCLISRVKSYWG